MKQFVYLLEEPISLNFPYLKTTIILQSDLLTNEVNEIASFILFGLYQNSPIEDIKRLVNVPHDTFEEIVFYLISHNLLDENHELTERGEMFAELVVEIETFNEKKHEAYINLYTGELELEKFDESLDAIHKVPIKIPKATRKLFELNVDAVPNTKDIINELIDDERFNPIFDEEFNETLHLQLKVEQKEYWGKRLITSFPIERANEDILGLYEIEEEGEQFHLAIPVEKHTYEPKHQLVLDYASQIPLLEQLEEELISDKGSKILKKKLQGQQMKKQTIYHYAYIEESLNEPLKSTKFQNRKVLSLPDNFEWIDKDYIREEHFGDIGNKWSIISTRSSEDTFVVSGPYNAFFYEQSDFDDEDYDDYDVFNNVSVSNSKITVNGKACEMTKKEQEELANRIGELRKGFDEIRLAAGIFKGKG